ncbi:MAG: extracellular solute-binding protein [Candidatus Handelsmanbacteria bacterium]|nr:extracellular solute-binding protein [Candidatus Handelsmanbacteria bacterium]
MLRRRFLIFAVALFLETSLAQAVSATQELIAWGAWRNRGLEAAFRQFELEHPEWALTTSAATSGRMDPQKLMCGIAGGSPPDLLIQDRFSVGEWAVRDAFLNLDEWIAQSLEQEAWAQHTRQYLSDPPAALIPLRQLIGALEPLGASRQLDLAREMEAELVRGGPAGLEEKAALLEELCQGIHPGRFFRTCWEEASFGEGEKRRVYAVPNSTDDRVLYYNEDLLERAGLVDGQGRAKPPADWDELKRWALALTEFDETGSMSRLGFAPNYGNSWLYIYGWLNGGEFMSADGRTCTLDDPRIAEALTYMVEVYDALGGIEKVDAFQSSFQGGEFDPFLTGKVAMKIDGNGFINTIVQYAPQLRFEVVAPPAPKGKTSITWSGGFSWAIPVGARNPRIAFELIRYLMTDRAWKLQSQVEARYAASRGRLFVPGMAPLPHVNQMTYDLLLRDNPELTERVKRNFLLCAELMQVSRFRPVTPVGQLLWDEHRRAYEKAVRHTYTPEEALARGKERVQDKLDLIYSGKVYPLLDWRYPLAGVAMLVLGGLGWCLWQWQRLGRPALHGYLFAAPWLIGLALLTAGPILVSILYSFCRYDVLHPPEFVGLDNYRRLFFADPLFWKSLGNTAFMMLGIPVGMAAGLGIAMLLNARVRGMQVYRTIFYLPAIMPMVASSILWIWVLNPEVGLINAFLKLLGWADPPNWLQSSDWLLGSKTAIILMGLWSAGSGMIVWLAGLKGISEHLYEAAALDGAGPFGRFLHVTLPMLSPYIFFNLIMGIIGTMQIFTQAYIMTEGGPDDSTMFYAYYLFNNAFRYFEMGYASALAWILFLVILALTLVQTKLAPRWVHYEAE